jgi:hypothetical protein
MYCIPDLDFYTKIVDIDVSRSKLDPQRRLMVSFKSSFCKPEQQTALADTFIDGGILESPMMINLNMKS